MEKAQNIFMVPARFGWSDVGCWDSVAKQLIKMKMAIAIVEMTKFVSLIHVTVMSIPQVM